MAAMLAEQERLAQHLSDQRRLFGDHREQHLRRAGGTGLCFRFRWRGYVRGSPAIVEIRVCQAKGAADLDLIDLIRWGIFHKARHLAQCLQIGLFKISTRTYHPWPNRRAGDILVTPMTSRSHVRTIRPVTRQCSWSGKRCTFSVSPG